LGLPNRPIRSKQGEGEFLSRKDLTTTMKEERVRLIREGCRRHCLNGSKTLSGELVVRPRLTVGQWQDEGFPENVEMPVYAQNQSDPSQNDGGKK
jgi:hypothetical protein